MPRPTKKKLELNSHSLRDMLQTIWSEADDQRTKGIYQYNRWNKDVRDNNDIALVGKTNNELLKIIDSSIDKKIQVARLVNDYLYKSSTSNENSSSNSSGTVSEESKETIYEMIQKAAAANNTEYIAPASNPEIQKSPF